MELRFRLPYSALIPLLREGRNGVYCSNDGQFMLVPSQIPYMCKAIIFITFPTLQDNSNTYLCDLTFSDLSRYVTTLTVDKDFFEEDKRPTRRRTIKSMVANSDVGFTIGMFQGYRDDVGAATSLLQGKFYRRSIKSPWEYTAISCGISEISVEEFTSTKTIFPYLSNYWYPQPNHLKIIVLGATVPTPKDLLIQFHPAIRSHPGKKVKKMTIITPSFTSIKHNTSQPFWGESLVVRNIKKYKQAAKFVASCVEAGSEIIVGEVTLNAWKFYQESIHNGQRCVDREFFLKKEKTQVSLLRLRFVSF
eukprot:TRINITY_DN7669_c0_g1_i1.p1 TRINITY_DN7669_c0_g1~~TRINITY_DN7669_c0_g1_i1.p1  ORF type:complete len:306 (-),score=49.79 TRINITY_DN7669_c0_g1_i1:125-1042(-)